jgi:hypothetical protein
VIAAIGVILANLGLSQRVAERWAPLVAAGLAIGALAGLGGGVALWFHFHDKHVVAADRQAANLDALQGQATADAHAADQRVQDALAGKDQEQAYDQAIHHPQAGDSGDPGVRLACERLRRDGQDTAAIPACGGR